MIKSYHFIRSGNVKVITNFTIKKKLQIEVVKNVISIQVRNEQMKEDIIVMFFVFFFLFFVFFFCFLSRIAFKLEKKKEKRKKKKGPPYTSA